MAQPWRNLGALAMEEDYGATLPWQLRPICLCPPSWKARQQLFYNTVRYGPDLVAIKNKFGEIISDPGFSITKISETIVDMSFSSYEELKGIARTLRKSGNCFAGMAITTYACAIESWLAYSTAALMRCLNVAVALWIYTAGCFEPGNPWGLTTATALQQFSWMVRGESFDFIAYQTPICEDGRRTDKESLPSLIGNCEVVMRHPLHLNVAGPLEPISLNDVVLCTHTSLDALNLVETMLQNWGGAASVAVFDYENIFSTAKLEAWLQQLAGQSNALRRVTLSMVGGQPARTAYDDIYPANLLRQVAIDAAIGDLILLADPGLHSPSEAFDAQQLDFPRSRLTLT